MDVGVATILWNLNPLSHVCLKTSYQIIRHVHCVQWPCHLQQSMFIMYLFVIDVSLISILFLQWRNFGSGLRVSAVEKGSGACLRGRGVKSVWGSGRILTKYISVYRTVPWLSHCITTAKEVLQLITLHYAILTKTFWCSWVAQFHTQ